MFALLAVTTAVLSVNNALGPVTCASMGFEQIQVGFTLTQFAGGFEAVSWQSAARFNAATALQAESFYPTSPGIPGSQHKQNWYLSGGIYSAVPRRGHLDLDRGQRIGYKQAALPGTGWVDQSQNGRGTSPVTSVMTGTRQFSTFFETFAVPLINRTDSEVIGDIQYSCGSFADQVYPLEEDVASYGVLIAPDDTLKFSLVGSDEDIVVWAKEVTQENIATGEDFDVDLYFSRSSSPVPLDKLAPGSASHGMRGELIWLPNVAQGEVVTIAVNSNPATFGGKGVFELRFGRVRRLRGVLRVGFSFNTDGVPSSIGEAETIVRIALKNWLVMSGGHMLFERAEITPNKTTSPLRSCECQNGPCDVCLRNVQGRSFGVGMVTLYRETDGTWYSSVLTHELGHHPLGAADEYADHYNSAFIDCHSDANCPSIMGIWVARVCNARTHGAVDWPTAHTSPSPVWFSPTCDAKFATSGAGPDSLWEFFKFGPTPPWDVDAHSVLEPWMTGQLDFFDSLIHVTMMPAIHD